VAFRGRIYKAPHAARLFRLAHIGTGKVRAVRGRQARPHRTSRSGRPARRTPNTTNPNLSNPSLCSDGGHCDGFAASCDLLIRIDPTK